MILKGSMQYLDITDQMRLLPVIVADEFRGNGLRTSTHAHPVHLQQHAKTKNQNEHKHHDHE